MSAEDWSQVTELFRRALELPEGEREAFLRGASFDPGVRDQVAALLVGDAGAERGGFLRPPGTGESLRSAVPDPHFAARRGIHLRCPQCQHPIEVVEARVPDEFTCEHCGTTIRTGAGSTASAGSRPGDTLRWEPSAALRSFGRFTLIHWVGEGAFGIVYKARDPQVGRIVALKVPRLGNLGSEKDREDFLREAKAVGRLRHASIVQVFDAGEVDGTPFIVSDFVEGVTIEDLRKDPGPAPDFRSCARIAAELADALQHAHERGIIHRDVKPSNVMIDRQGLARLMDFGLAKRGEAELTIAVSGRPMGTPAYMSPEQARGEGKHVDGRTDVYGLGALLYYLIAGSAPFAGTERMILLKVIHDDPPTPRSLNERIPRDLQTICQAAMAKEPSRRYATARDLAADLRRFLDGRTISRRPAGPLEKAWRACARNPRLSLAIGTASAALVAVAAVSTLLAVATHRSAVARARDLSMAHQHAALQLLERGEIGPGLLWLERALRLAEDVGDVDLAHSAGANIAAWSREHPPLRATFAHPAEVRRAALSPDGKGLLAACADGTARLWDVASGGPIAGPLRHGRKVRSVAYSPDGRLALTAGEDGEIRLWDASTGREVDAKPSGPGFALREAAFGEGGRTVVAVGQDGTFRRWDAATGRALGGVIGQPWATTTAAAISPGGRWGLVATLSDDGTREVRLWDLASGLPVGGPLGHGDGVWAVAFSPDEKTVATGCGDTRVRLWDVATAAPIGEIPGCSKDIAGLCFSPDGTALLLATGEKTARVFDVATRLPRGDVLRTGALMNVAAFSPDGRMVATGCLDGRARLWDARTGRPIGLALPHQADVTHLAFLPDSGSLLVCSGEKAVRIWSVDAPAASPVALAIPGKANVAVHSPDGAIVAVGNDLGEVLLRDGGDGRPIAPPWRHGEAVRRLAFAGDGKALLVGGEHGRVQLRRVADGQPIGPAHAMKGWIVAAASSRDGSTVVAACEDGTALVIDARSGLARGPTLRHDGRIELVASNADGSLVATASSDLTVRLWDGPTGRAIMGPLRHDGHVVELALSLDDKRLITVEREGTAARLWDVASGRQLARFEHDGPVNIVKFSPDGLTALTGGFDAKVRLWDVESGRRKGPILSGIGEVVWAAAFSEDGRLVAVGGRNGDVRLFEVSKGLGVGPLLSIPGHRVEGLAFHPGRIAVKARGEDSAVRLWNIPRPDATDVDVSGLTGLRLDGRDEFVILDGATLKDRRARKAAASP